MNKILAELYRLSDEWQVMVPEVSYSTDKRISYGNSGYGYYKTRYSNSVCFVVEWNWKLTGAYLRKIGVEERIFYNYTLYYRHRYYIPQLEDNLTLYPKLVDPMGIASVNATAAEGLWIIGVPAKYTTCNLTDSFGIRISLGKG